MGWLHNNTAKLEYLCKVKTDFTFQIHLQDIHNEHLTKDLISLRLGWHPLAIESGRCIGIERNNRICKLCRSEAVESEYNFLLCCPLYDEKRKIYIARVPWPSLQKFYYCGAA